jgi:hypothetical protein
MVQVCRLTCPAVSYKFWTGAQSTKVGRADSFWKHIIVGWRMMVTCSFMKRWTVFATGKEKPNGKLLTSQSASKDSVLLSEPLSAQLSDHVHDTPKIM